jgi:hypothetical protein
VLLYAGHVAGVTMKLRLQAAPFALGVHCYGHRVNLVGAGLAGEPMMTVLDRLVSSVYTHFCLSSERTWELGEFQKLLGVQQHRILNAANTR